MKTSHLVLLSFFVNAILAGISSQTMQASGQNGNQEKDGLTQNDPVTGLPTINNWTLAQEVEAGKELEPGFIKRELKGGFEIDSDEKARDRVDRILAPLIKVCHLPRIPWRFHISSNPQWNASARWGGVIFVYRGLLDDVSDTELAAVLGHEMAHVTCRHLTESLTHQQIVGLLSEKARSAFYKASYSTEQEEEADKVGILCMSLAGFDPRNVSPMWHRRKKIEGNAPRDYLNDHPLSQQRADLTKRWGETATKYLVGTGQVNPDFGTILIDNELVPRIGSTGNEAVDFLSAALLESLQFRKTKEEAKHREEAAAAAKEAELKRKAKALEFLRIDEVKVGKTKDNKPGVFAHIKNNSNSAMKWIDIQFAYKTTTGTWEPYGKPVRLEVLPSGESRTWGTLITEEKFLRATFGAKIIDLDY